MGRPRLSRDPLVKLTFMIQPEVLARLDALTAAQQAAQQYARRERSDICREAIVRGLAQMEDEQQAAPHGRPARRQARTGGDNAA